MKQDSGLSITLQTGFIVSNGGVPEICRWRPNATAYNSPSIPPFSFKFSPLLDTKKQPSRIGSGIRSKKQSQWK